jgi:hypothetical protein
MDLRDIGLDGSNWIWLAQDRVQWRAFVNMVMKLGFHKESRTFLTGWVAISFSNNILHHGVNK